MKKPTFSIFLCCSLAILLLLAESCKKYADGPSLTIYTKKQRVIGVWEFELNPENQRTDWSSSPITSNWFAGDVIEFTKDMKVLWNGAESGTWGFDEEKEYLIVTAFPCCSDGWWITKLENNNIWVQTFAVNSTDVYVWHLKRIK